MFSFSGMAIAKPVSWQNQNVYKGFNFSPDMDFGAGKYAIASYDENRKMEMVSLINANGTVYNGNIDVSLGASNPSDPDVSWNGTTFGVFWFDSWRVYYASVHPDGYLVTNPVMVYEGAVHVSATWNKKSQEYGVVFWGGNDWNPAGARFLRVDQYGRVLAPEVALNSVNGGGYYRPRIATDGSGFGVTWSDMRTCDGTCREVAFAYVSKDGYKVGGDVILTSTGAEHVNDIVWNGEEFAMVTYGNNGVSMVRVDKGGNLLQFSSLTGDPPYSNNMRLSWDKNHYLLTTIGYTNKTDIDILLYKYDRFGKIIGSPTDISESTTIDYYPSNAVVSGNSIAVAWVGDLWGQDQGILFVSGK